MRADDVSLCIPKGSFFALLGANGAGTSTLIGLISGTVKMQEGSKVKEKEKNEHHYKVKVNPHKE